MSRINNGMPEPKSERDQVALQEVKESTEALERSYAILNTIHEACYELDNSGTVVFVNRQALEWWELKEEQVLGHNLWEIFPEAKSTHCYKAVQVDALENKKFSQSEYMSPVIDKWIALSVTPTETGCIVIFRDIDKRKNAEQEVLRLKDEVAQNATDKYLTLFNNVPQGFCIIEMIFDETGKAADYRFLETNPVFEQQTGLKDALGKTMRQLQPAHDQHWFDIYGEVATTRKPVHFENVATHLTPAGLETGVWYDVFAFPFGAADQPRIAVLFNNITSRKKSELESRKSEQRLAQELKDATKLQQISNRLIEEDDIQALYNAILSSAMELMNADFASIQTVVKDRDELRLLAYKGFHPESARHWEIVKDVSSSCGIAFATGTRIIFSDIDNCPFKINKDDYDHYRLSGIVSMQSTPLISRSGKNVGMISTHWKRVHEPSEHELKLFDVVARQVADLIQQRQAEEDLRKSEAQLAAAFAVMPVAVGFFDINGLLLLSNEEMKHYLPSGILPSMDDANSSRWEVYDANGARVERRNYPTVRALRGETVLPGMEVLFTGNDGNKRWTWVASAPFRDNSGKIIGATSVVSDIHELKQTSDALRASREELRQFNLLLEKKVNERTVELQLSQHELEMSNRHLKLTIDQLESFNYIASHDLKEPLRKIRTFASMLDQHQLKDATLTKYLGRIQDASARMNQLIDDLLAYSRLNNISTEAFEQTDMNRILENVKADFELAINEKNAVVEHDTLPVLNAIPFQMNQLFSNLLSNSLKFANGKPEIKITCKTVTGSDLEKIAGAEADKHYSEISFSDNGIGFESQYSEKIFQVFQRLHSQASYPGTGIGLSIAEKVVENHKGFILASGEVGKGAVFTVYLPL
ncbi:PAS domain-containing sensor histidine kinase [Flavihumibacter solisilvae]|uniref:PAS domain-containing sensor histidine kinase n=1 Tax=Flavihumibacter solisilvae TaxID=1349421 RepID=UPI00068EDABF|nr:PAS domain S-box protein [Flavihumibacter solisilvae]